MRLFLTGGTGFIGTHLVRALLERGDECVVLSRSDQDPWKRAGVRVVAGDSTAPGNWFAELAGCDAVVNLAGARIVEPAHRWTSARKASLRHSRIETTRRVVEAIAGAGGRVSVLVSGSAIGFYGPRGDDVVDESAPAGSDFLATLAAEWEAAALEAASLVRVVLLRTGLALGRGGGVLDALTPLFKLGLGGPWGDGTQWWSWIHVEDQVRLILQLIDGKLAGPVNATAPHPVTVNAFARALGAALHRPALARAPAFALRMVLGEAAEALLDLQRVIPRRALESGFAFRYPEVGTALAEVFGNRG
jgi:uncharacterized protein (TIGR01777 family)